MWKWVVAVAGAGMVLIAGATTTPIVGQASLPSRAYTPPKTRAGQPDLQGIWQVVNTAAWDVEGNAIPYQEWALAKKQDNYQNRATADPESTRSPSR